MKTLVRRRRIQHLQEPKRENKLIRYKVRLRELSNTQTKALLAMYSDLGHTTAEIARRFGICIATVTNVAKRAGFPKRWFVLWLNYPGTSVPPI